MGVIGRSRPRPGPEHTPATVAMPWRFFATRAGQAGSPLYRVLQDRGRIACLVSGDNVTTWRDHARTKTGYGPYALGGCRELTADGSAIGTFEHGKKVYFLRICPKSRGKPNR